MRLILIICFVFVSESIFCQPVKREMRGAWLTTFLDIDWPNRSQTPQQQQESLIAILNTYQKMGINTVFMQVRSQCDAMYQSKYEPWSADLTGVQGLAPFPLWDPLALAITECHKRALEIHAWINPYRAVANTNNLQNFSATHVARVHPEWLLTSGTLKTLNPGLPEVREYILMIIKDIAERYDLDGIHFDDYFYPEGFINDEETFLKYPNGIQNKADWRRNNVSMLIKELNSALTAMKPWLKFGVSPSGIYRNSKDPAIGSPTNGFEHYTTLYSDTRKWLEEGWVDYLIPQVYYSNRQTSAPYPVVVNWWQQHTYGRHMYIGIGSYKIGNGESAWNNPDETPSQVRYSRTFPSIKGVSFYNTASLMANRLGVKDSLQKIFSGVALPPEMSWKKSAAPETPSNVTISRRNSSSFLTWNTSGETSEMKKARNYIVYRSENADINFNDPSNIIAIISDSSYNDFTTFEKPMFYAISALSRLQNESLPSAIVSASAVKIPATYVLSGLIEKDGEVKLWWRDNALDSVERFEIEKSTDGNSYNLLKTINVDKSPDEYVANDIITASNYYRLKAVNKNGRSTFSKPVLINYYLEKIAKTDPVKNATPEKISLSPEVVRKDSVNNVVNENLVMPFSATSPGTNIIINILAIGNMTYHVYKEQVQITWGKIKTARANIRLQLPGTNELLAGKYLLIIDMDGKKQIVPFEVR